MQSKFGNKRMVVLVGGFLLVAVIIIVAVVTYALANSRPLVNVSDFDSCVRAGNPVMESYPPRCTHNNKTYTQKI